MQAKSVSSLSPKGGIKGSLPYDEANSCENIPTVVSMRWNDSFRDLPADVESADDGLRPSSTEETFRPASSPFPHTPPVGRDQEGRVKWAGIFAPSELLATPRSPSSVSPASAREYASASNTQPLVPVAAPSGRLVDEDDTSRPSSAIGLGGLLNMIRSRISRSNARTGPSAPGPRGNDAAVCVDTSPGNKSGICYLETSQHCDIRPIRPTPNPQICRKFEFTLVITLRLLC